MFTIASLNSVALLLPVRGQDAYDRRCRFAWFHYQQSQSLMNHLNGGSLKSNGKIRQPISGITEKQPGYITCTRIDVYSRCIA